jgi:putative GTP pyrophosphokinase
LPEYSRFEGCKVEIQVRSILQHAWAEIEHDLGYKSEREIPANVRREFFRVAGLLEVADAEFQRIRDRLQEYARAVTKQIAEAPGSVLLDLTSFGVFVRENDVVRQCDLLIAAGTGRVLTEPEDEPRTFYHSILLRAVSYFGFKTIGQLETALREKSEIVVRLALTQVEKEPSRLFSGISVFWLCYLLAAEREGATTLINYMNAIGIGMRDEERAAWARTVYEAYKGVAESR